MDPNVLQALVGNLSHGFQLGAFTKDFQSSLPDDGICTICYVDNGGKTHKLKVTPPTVTAVAEPIHDQGYHSVFILSGHVYFGQLQITPDQRFIKLRDAHYLLPVENGHREFQLMKVGRELHAPVDEMTINMTYVVLWQPLSDDGPVVRAILASKQ